MSNLDQEFNNLVNDMYQKINEREKNEELTSDEAQTLRIMISERINQSFETWEKSYSDYEDSWYDSGCSE